MNASVSPKTLAQLKLMQATAAKAAMVESMEQAVARAALEQARAVLAKVNKITNAKMRTAMQAQVMQDMNSLRSKTADKMSKRVAVMVEYANLGGAWGTAQELAAQDSMGVAA